MHINHMYRNMTFSLNMYDGEKAFQVLLYKQCENVPKIRVAHIHN